MAYADLQALEDYFSKHAGAGIAVAIYDENVPGVPLIAAATGINSNDDFEQLPVEEAGNDGTDEIVSGRHGPVAANIQGLWSPAYNDRLPTRQSFLGKTYTVMELIAPGRPGAGTPVNVYTGCKLSRNGTAHGARGLKTIDLAMVGERRYNGAEWAALTGG